MKTEKEINEKLIYFEGYIAGQKSSFAPDEEEIKNTVNKISILKWILEKCEEWKYAVKTTV